MTYLPLHASQSHLQDNEVERFECVFCDDFTLVTEGQSVPADSFLEAQRMPLFLHCSVRSCKACGSKLDDLVEAVERGEQDIVSAVRAALGRLGST